MGTKFKSRVGDKALNRLYDAVANYIEKRGGKVVVVGGVEIQQWPQDGEFRFSVAIRCTGKVPKFVK